MSYSLTNYLNNKALFLRWVKPITRPFHNRVISIINKAIYATITISKKEFINELRTSIEHNRGYAAGKIGRTAQYMMYHEILLRKETNSEKIKEFQNGLEFQCLKQQGIFPNDPDFYLRYSKWYVGHVRNIDCLGLCYYPQELEIIKYYKLHNKMIYYPKQEPDRSSPSDEKSCYLHYFRDKKLLIVCPFAKVLAKRAKKEIFEGVWSKTGKKWFYPGDVDALEFPYGFSRETHKKYSTVIDLYNYIITEINKKDFDIALIGAAGLAIPIASYVKSLGKVGIDLGGALQFYFGVLGKRWRSWEDFRALYFNDHWIDMPAKYKPKETDVCDSGAYW